MNQLTVKCYKLGIFKLSQKKIERWFLKKKSDKLYLAIEIGSYEFRKAAYAKLIHIEPEKKINWLFQAVNDPIFPVFEWAYNELSNVKTLSQEQKMNLANKKVEWIIKQKKEINGLGKKMIGEGFDPMWVKADRITMNREANFEQVQRNMRPPA